jgi:hypothetical protein
VTVSKEKCIPQAVVKIQLTVKKYFEDIRYGSTSTISCELLHNSYSNTVIMAHSLAGAHADHRQPTFTSFTGAAFMSH